MHTGDRLEHALHHPWRAFRALGNTWKLKWARLPDDAWGNTDWKTRTVTVSPDLDQAERRCTIAHETQHILRGPAPETMRTWEEGVVDRNVARLLLPEVRAIGDALAWAQWHTDEAGLQTAAAELWVDEFVLETRLTHLHPSEKGYLRQRWADWHHDQRAGLPHVGHDGRRERNARGLV